MRDIFNVEAGPVTMRQIANTLDVPRRQVWNKWKALSAREPLREMMVPLDDKQPILLHPRAANQIAWHLETRRGKVF